MLSTPILFPKTRADIARDYRERKKNRGEKPASGAGGDSSKWGKAQFIALDGEGVNVGPKTEFIVGVDKKKYRAARHDYTLLSASSGESLYRNGKRLASQDCIDWLCDLSDEYPKAIFVIFAGGYDINHILMFGFERDILQKISRGEEHQFEYKKDWYSIEYRSRKSLTLRRGRSWVEDDYGDTHIKWKSRIIIWDVFGFFQESFVGVMGKWLGTDYKDYELIKMMKKQRGDFSKIEQKKINAYNMAEVEALVAIMQKVHGAVKGLDLKCYRWDGAGSIASAMFRKHEIKQFKNNDIPKGPAWAARHAYAGGRIEVCKIGFHDGPVFDYDINSAYPAVMRQVPCLAHGEWTHGTGTPPPGFTLVRVKYNFEGGQRFYPLFFRTRRMQISFPSDGEGWYWFPEYEAAQLCPGECEAVEYWHFKPGCDHVPFQWIPGYYETRKQWLKHATEDWQNGGEKIIKLGLNSLYGKCAQQLGGTDTCPPAYHQLEWAGYITSATRARLYVAAWAKPNAIIGFATDGIFATEEIDIDVADITRQLGAWELKQPCPQGMTIAMAGVYWWHRGKNAYTHFSRGFDKDSMRTPDLILNAWKNGRDIIDIPLHRLIGMGTACTSDTLFEMRGRFIEGTRSLRLDGKSHKRRACDIIRDKPHKQLVDLEATPNAEYGYNDQKLSYPYPLKWIEGDGGKDAYENDLEISRENEDTANI